MESAVSYAASAPRREPGASLAAGPFFVVPELCKLPDFLRERLNASGCNWSVDLPSLRDAPWPDRFSDSASGSSFRMTHAGHNSAPKLRSHSVVLVPWAEVPHPVRVGLRRE